MSVIRVNKTKDFTVMSNHHFRDRRLSLKAKGLLSEMLSLPEGWDYTVAGLVAINKENESAVKSALKELAQYGYLVVTKLMPNETESGRIEYIYDIYEQPHGIQAIEKQGIENLGVEIQAVENQPQYNTNNKVSKNKILKNKVSKVERHKYGEYKNVLLSDDELEKLKNEFTDWQERIERVSSYCASTGKTYKNYLATIRNWARDEKKRTEPKPKKEVDQDYLNYLDSLVNK